jgi:hypothetical protein
MGAYDIFFYTLGLGLNLIQLLILGINLITKLFFFFFCVEKLHLHHLTIIIFATSRSLNVSIFAMFHLFIGFRAVKF